MGCGNSRFDRRKERAGNYNTVATQFIGGEENEFDGFPYDRVLWAVDKTKESSENFHIEDDMSAGNEDQIKKVYEAIVKHAENHVKVAGENQGSDDKPVILHDKWNSKDVLAHWKDSLAHLKENSGFAAGGEEMMMEGGDEGEKKEDPIDPGAGDMMMGMEGMAIEKSESPFKYEGDERDYKGWKNFPAAVLRNMIVHGSFFDEAKACAVAWEFDHENAPKENALHHAAALVSATASKGVTGEQTVFFGSYLGADDLKSLKDMATGDNKKIHFPWVSVGWATEDEAKRSFDHAPAPGGGDILGESLAQMNKATGMLTFGMAGGDDGQSRVIFEVEKAAAFQFLTCRWVVHRLNGVISAHEEKDGV